MEPLKQNIVNLERDIFIFCIIVSFFYCQKYANPIRRDECKR